MEENGTVIAVEGDRARVRLLRRATCDKCGMCGMGQHPEIVVEVTNSAQARPGDEVRLAVESGNVLRAAGAAYVVPLAALFGGYLLTRFVLGSLGVDDPREGMSIAGGFLALVLSYYWLRSFDRRSGDRFSPRMVAVIGHPPADRAQE